jgi:hypothetical protein
MNNCDQNVRPDGNTTPRQPDPPTFANYIPRVARAVTPSTRRVYSTYWNRAIEAWGPLPITAVTALGAC